MELAELEAFVRDHPEVGRLTDTFTKRIRNRVRRGARSAVRQPRRRDQDRASARAGFRVKGADYGFADILEAGELLSAVITNPDAALDAIAGEAAREVS